MLYVGFGDLAGEHCGKFAIPDKPFIMRTHGFHTQRFNSLRTLALPVRMARTEQAGPEFRSSQVSSFLFIHFQVLNRDIFQLLEFFLRESSAADQLLHQRQHIRQEARQTIHHDSDTIGSMGHFRECPKAVERFADLLGRHSVHSFRQHLYREIGRRRFAFVPITCFEYAFEAHHRLFPDINHMQRDPIVEGIGLRFRQVYGLNDLEIRSNGTVQ